jgi:hypothetical protein
MPMLRGFNPGIDALLARTAVIARDEEAFWQAEVARVLPQVLLPGKPVRGGGRAVSTAVGEASCAVEIARLAAMPAALRRRVVRAAARSLFARAKRVAIELGGDGEGAGAGGLWRRCGGDGPHRQPAGAARRAARGAVGAGAADCGGRARPGMIAGKW